MLQIDAYDPHVASVMNRKVASEEEAKSLLIAARRMGYTRFYAKTADNKVVFMAWRQPSDDWVVARNLAHGHNKTTGAHQP